MNFSLTKGSRDGEILKYSKIMLTLVGVTPIEIRNRLVSIMYGIFFWFCTLCTTTLFIMNAVSDYQHFCENDWGAFFVNWSYTLVALDGLIKAILLRDDFLKKIIPKVHLFESLVSKLEGDNIYRSFITISRKTAFVFLSGSIGTLLCLFVRPLFTTIQKQDGTIGRRLIVTYWHFIDPDQHFGAAYLTELVMMLTTSQHVLYTDLLICTLLMCCCAQLKIIQKRIENITLYSVKMATEHEITNEAAQLVIVKEIVVLHQNVINMVHDLEKKFRTYFLFQFVTSSIKGSFAVINMLWRELDFLEKLTEFYYITILMVEVFLLYWCANKIILESSDGIYNAVRLSNYDELTPSARKVLVLTMLRATAPLSLSIGPFDIVSVETFIKILKVFYYTLSILNFFRTKE